MKPLALLLLLAATLSSGALKIRVPHSDSAPLLGGTRVGIAQSAIQKAPANFEGARL
jgi:hypothetical protein